MPFCRRHRAPRERQWRGGFDPGNLRGWGLSAATVAVDKTLQRARLGTARLGVILQEWTMNTVVVELFTLAALGMRHICV